MKFLIPVLSALLLCACNNGNNSSQESSSLSPENNSSPPENNNSTTKSISVKDLDMTGTWLMKTEYKQYKTSTGEYLYSDFAEITYIMEDTPAGVKYEKCATYGGTSPYGVKTDEHFYMGFSESGYTLQSDGTLIYDNSQFDLDVTSSSQIFWDTVRSNTLSPAPVTAEILALDQERISGTYAFTGQDGNNYDGEFEIFF